MGPIPVELDEERLKAGANYLAALRALGLEPEALFWAWDRVETRFVLMLVTRYFDIVGPAEVSKLLFKAYNKACTPREIDPFILRLHSPDHTMIRTLTDAVSSLQIQLVDTGEIVGEDVISSVFDTGHIAFPMKDIYVWKDVRRPGVDLLRKWKFISRKVDGLAA